MIGMAVFLALYGLIGSWGAALVIIIGTGFMYGVWAAAGVLEVKGTRGLAVIALGSLASLVPLSIAASLIEPAPLPKLTLHRSDGQVVHGRLVAETGENWYVAHPDHSVKAISDSAVDRAVIIYEKRDQTPSLWSEGFH